MLLPKMKIVHQNLSFVFDIRKHAIEERLRLLIVVG